MIYRFLTSPWSRNACAAVAGVALICGAVMPGKAMGRYVVLPADAAANDADVDAWLVKAIDYTRTLPPKR